MKRRLLPGTLLLHGCLLGACLFSAPDASALKSDRNQPIKIQADTAIVNEAEGRTSYKGNVTIDQGTLHLAADEVEIYSTNREVNLIVAKARAESTLVHYEQQKERSHTGKDANGNDRHPPENQEPELVTADARNITYLVKEGQFHLQGNARLQQAGDIFEGEFLSYDLGSGIVKLRAGEQDDDRVNMTISPQSQ